MNKEHDKLDLNYPFFSQENQEERFKDLKYKHSNTLKNKFDIKSSYKLSEKEENIITIKIVRFLEQKEEIYERVQLETQDDKIAFLKAINNYLYKEIYDFAGKFRSYDFAGQSNDNPHYFIQPVKLENFDLAFDEVFKGFDKDYYERCSYEEKVALFSLNMSKLYDIQPFVKGNNVTTLLFSQLFAERELGLEIDIDRLLKNNDVSELFALAHEKDLLPLIEAMDECTSEPHRYDKLFEDELENEEIEQDEELEI